MTRRPLDAPIAEMVRRIVDRFHPDKIILFGSHARGAARPGSDVDLLVVMPVPGSKRRQAVEIDVALADVGVPKDLIVITPAEFAADRGAIGGIVGPALTEGRVLYERRV